MRLASGEPVVVDALTGPLPAAVLQACPSICFSLSRAQALRNGSPPPCDELPAGGPNDEL